MLATACTADEVSEQVLAHLVEQYPARQQFRDHYRDMAKMLGFDGHIAWAEAMP